MSSEQNLPERPAGDGPTAEGAEGGEKLSKKALKKLEKEREKVESTQWHIIYIGFTFNGKRQSHDQTTNLYSRPRKRRHYKRKKLPQKQLLMQQMYRRVTTEKHQ